MLFDLDHFKAVNDQHRHHAGDQVLCRVADVIAATAGASRLTARMGGEEFAVLIVSPPTGALAVRLWVALREVEHPELTGQRVTASLGIGEVTMGDGFESAYARVDTALYRAKRQGATGLSVRKLC